MNCNSYHDYRSTNFFSSLDGLRCLAVLAVIWHHTAPRIKEVNLTSQGYLGVDLFFTVSGFLITTLLLREREQWGEISLKAFYIRRSLRIFPLYYTVLAIYIFAVWVMESNTDAGKAFFSNLPYFLTYTSNWFVAPDTRVIFYFAWSLATEEQFYLFWPTVERWLRGWRILGAIFTLILAQSVVTSAISSGNLSPNHLWVVILLSVHPAILGGIVMAHILHDQRTFQFASPLLSAKWAAPLLLVGLLIAIELKLAPNYVWLLMALLVASAAISEANGLSRLLKWSPIAHIGLVSYGMYLMHMLCYNAVKKLLHITDFEKIWLYFPLTLALTILAATISYRYYESWFLRLKSKFVRVRTRDPIGCGRLE